MADVLSQSQIDALLKSMSADAPAQEKKTESVQPLSPEEKNYIKYDFFSPRKFTKEKMKILRSVFENYARILTSQINGIFRVIDVYKRQAQREIGLAIGEPPIARGYTPSIYAEFPRLLERSGNFAKGSITGIYTVLVEGDDTNEPVADTVRGILDGHIVLSRQLANANHFPAIDISASISRLMNDIAGEEHRKAASRFRNMLSLYQKNADLISIGAYKKGANSALDEAVDRIGDMLSLIHI